MQTLVEHEIGARRDIGPGRKGANGAASRFCRSLVVEIVPRAAMAGFAIGLEGAFQFGNEIGLEPEMAEGIVAGPRGVRNLLFHARAVEAVKRITLDMGRIDILAAKDLRECHFDGRGASPR